MKDPSFICRSMSVFVTRAVDPAERLENARRRAGACRGKALAHERGLALVAAPTEQEPFKKGLRP